MVYICKLIHGLSVFAIIHGLYVFAIIHGLHVCCNSSSTYFVIYACFNNIARPMENELAQIVLYQLLSMM